MKDLKSAATSFNELKNYLKLNIKNISETKITIASYFMSTFYKNNFYNNILIPENLLPGEFIKTNNAIKYKQSIDEKNLTSFKSLPHKLHFINKNLSIQDQHKIEYLINNIIHQIKPANDKALINRLKLEKNIYETKRNHPINLTINPKTNIIK